jgi:hypothetical protein
MTVAIARPHAFGMAGESSDYTLKAAELAGGGANLARRQGKPWWKTGAFKYLLSI